MTQVRHARLLIVPVQTDRAPRFRHVAAAVADDTAARMSATNSSRVANEVIVRCFLPGYGTVQSSD
jgi:hypothetical protein